jgi:replication factor C subunit 3/5
MATECNKPKMLWETQQPKHLDQMSVHKKLNDDLKKMVQWDDSPHLFFYGPPGCGKRTRIMAMLREQFGDASVDDAIQITTTFETEKDESNINVTMLKSTVFTEIDIRNNSHNDKKVVSSVIKNMSKQVGIRTSSNKTGIKILVIKNACELSREAQQTLRRMMEKYADCCRIILCASSRDKIMAPIRSRCLCIRVPKPTREELLEIIETDTGHLDIDIRNRIIDESDSHMKKLFLIIEAYFYTGGHFICGTAKWQRLVDSIIEILSTEFQTQVELVKKVRDVFYELVSIGTPATLVIHGMVEKLIIKYPHIKLDALYWASEYEHRSKLTRFDKTIFHLEAFLTRILLLLRTINPKQ